MKKNDILIVALLISLLLGLKFIDDHVFKKILPSRAQPARALATAKTGTTASSTAEIKPELASVPAAAAPAVTQSVEKAEAEAVDATPAQTAELKNARMKIS